ncbi:TrkH-domain-containing protein [Epithele typhae]|uniref:TrkH-domain-containing protein n=1 Tax=Epithele typhae TaxID=378194 RepID=UPI002008A6F0|nr:TrkH-domain-containing protein [Epithele typhae]KAH9927443.1 TrkH-domain-containing protein [Epithele typhae]
MAFTDVIYYQWSQFYQWLEKELNFFRVHLLYFTITPLIFTFIFYASNGKFHISFIDSMFLCYSAMTVTGLSTVNLSTLTVWQQTILFICMLVGNVTMVAWVMVLIRTNYFRQYIIDRERKRTVLQSIRDRFTGKSPVHRATDPEHRGSGVEKHKSHGSSGIKASDGIGAAMAGGAITGLGLGIALNVPAEQVAAPPDSPKAWHGSDEHIQVEIGSTLRASPIEDLGDDSQERGIITDMNSFTSSPRSGAMALHPESPPARQLHFAANVQPFSAGAVRRRPGVPIPRRRTIIAPTYYDLSHPAVGQRHKDQGLGGFPGPITLGRRFVKRYLPGVQRQMTIFIEGHHAEEKHVSSWQAISANLTGLVIGRNSEINTDELSDEQLEELGGIEYQALCLLNYIVILYFIGTQLVSFILIAPWLSTSHAYDGVFDTQPRLVNKSWFTLFQIVGAYTGGGMSLVDTGMVPFQQAYLMIFSLIFAILAGNHGLPVFLRFSIWIYTRSPRRCFLYLFPSYVTWYLLATLVFFTAVEWICFIVLNLGLDALSSLSVGTRVVAGLFQSFAIRASGFPIINLSALAPSFQFLCVVMMYIAVYPVALSIRSTNVYEEQSLGVFEEAPADEDEEPALNETSTRSERISKYFGWHLRRQVAFDIWWLVWAIFAICIIERTKIMDDVNAPWFNIFRIVFELVSAFGGIGLTLGIPTENFAFSGAFGPLSKLVVIIIMVRGRHRGLPVAIDRAIMLPEELRKRTEESEQANAMAEQARMAAELAAEKDTHEHA